MIEGITIALQSYYDTASSAKAILEDAITQIKNNYIGLMLTEKIGEAQDIYNTTLNESRQENYNVCLEILGGVSDQVKKVLEVPVPTDFIATLEALKQVKEPTEKEVDTVVNAYKNNYFAYRAICDFLKTSKPVTVDDLEEDLETLKKELHNCFYSDNIEGYHFRNWKDGTILASYDELVKAFVEGRFEDAVQKDSDKDRNIDSERLNNKG